MNCSSGKQQHDTLEVAEEFADLAKATWGGEFTAYYCCECLTYHVGHVRTRIPKHFRKRRSTGGWSN